MKFRIHYTLKNGLEDSIIIEGESLAQIKKYADIELDKRNATDPWSEEI